MNTSANINIAGQLTKDLKRRNPKLTYSSRQLIDMALPESNYIIGDWCVEGAPILISAASKCGKSLFAYTLMHHISLGIPAFGWTTPIDGCEVAIVDGEMRPATIKHRLNIIRTIADGDPGNITLVTRENYTDLNLPFPDLSRIDEVAKLLDSLGSVKVALFDNVNAFFQGDENRGEYWEPVQRLIFECRARKITPIIIHHTSKTNPGSPSGNSKSERIPEVIIILEKIGEVAGAEAYFNIRFKSLRDISRTAINCSAQLRLDESGRAAWHLGDVVDTGYAEQAAKFGQIDIVHGLRREGLSIRAISEVTGVKKSTVGEWLKKASDTVSGLSGAENPDSPDTMDIFKQEVSEKNFLRVGNTNDR